MSEKEWSKSELCIGCLWGFQKGQKMDEDLDNMTREALLAEAKKLRIAIRKHRNASGHELCWHHPDLWALLPDKVLPTIAVPDWPQFMEGCVSYRRSLDLQAPDASRTQEPFKP